MGRRAADRRVQWCDGGQQRPLLWRLSLVVPVALLVVAIVATTLYCRELLLRAASGFEPVAGGNMLLIAAIGYLLAATAVVALQAGRVAHRVAGPEYRLRQALQRIRTGDLSFRVHLRRGDLLQGLAHECNELLDWLNANPPAGSRTGSDVLELETEPVPESDLRPSTAVVGERP